MTASDPKLPEPDLSGQTLDRYQLVRRIGVGGMGAVYEAEHTRLRKRFAVKLLRHELAQDETFRKRFLREARAASAITHPNVVGISDFGETDDGHVFFVMEMLGGRDLQELLEAAGKLPWPRTRDILVQITSALQAAHLQDIIHRDMKPSNVFLADVPGKGDEDVVKVLDFGIAKLSGHMGEATVKLTSTDEIFGTVAYMAPEMAMGINDDRRSDVYAVGVMMYRMLTGALPFTQGTAFQILSQHINAPVPPPRAKEPSIPVEVEAILLRALAKNVDDRFASMEDFGRALRRGTLEATESLTVLRAEQLVGIPKVQAHAPATTIDKTTPLPAAAAALGTPLTTIVATPIAPQISDSAAVPIAVAPTVVSSPIVLAPSDSAAMPPSGPAAPAWTEPRRSPLRFVVPALGVAALAGVVAFFATRDPEPTSTTAPAAPSTSIAARQDAKDPPKPIAPNEPTPAVKDPPTPATKELVDEPVPTPEEPTPEGGAAADEVIAEPTPTEPETAEPAPAKPKPPKPKAKPKTDAEVVAGLKAKLASKCKTDGDTRVKVKIEGMVTSSGGTTGLYITPPNGPGACASKVVSAAKFDPTLGPRRIPPFSVEL